ncbi:ABC transporter ATP-binding protein [Microvirga sp. BT689]|uniref:ABC transporter ATP-binding protein n=1 Tax=Microvirga arvi TaxID=2778731 RepID=UPI00194F8671|nr:ABC transporter ATP-binding protein [Microvirga arvi]MBM6583757.1 ABC transporter ATP-binding protein [Microvirga arvi]
MAYVEARDLGVQYPVLTSSARSLKNTILSRTTGGRIAGNKAHFIQIRALDHLNFRFHPGDRVALIGHNGSGKSTLLRVLAGIYHPTAGTIQVSGRVAALFDSAFGMDIDATGYENIILRAKYLGIPRSEINRQIEEIADFTDLGEFLQMPIRTYSAGMTARLAFAISTSVNADILLIDEGVGAGDAAFMAKANKRLQELIDRSPIVVFASHDQKTVRDFCTRGLVLQSGNLIYDGPVEEAYAQYDTIVGAALR